ncbi:MAG: hypothetical protein ABGZ35_10935 [Planctomycetaceae bacterium]|jgi:hypothetical protein
MISRGFVVLVLSLLVGWAATGGGRFQAFALGLSSVALLILAVLCFAAGITGEPPVHGGDPH